METRETPGSYSLESDPKYLNFKKVEVTKRDETKPWKPPVEVKVTLANGNEETIDAGSPFFTFLDKDLNKLTVGAADAGHIDELHIKGTDLGSKFSQATLEELMNDIAEKLPPTIAQQEGISAFALDMGKKMGKEGLSTLEELTKAGILNETDVQTAEAMRPDVYKLNKSGTAEEKDAFVKKFASDHPENKVQFKLIRGAVLVPVVKAEKQDTTKLYLCFGPKADKTKPMWTAAPGRYMPRHPNPVQFKPEEGGTEGDLYKESEKAWFDTAMLEG